MPQQGSTKRAAFAVCAAFVLTTALGGALIEERLAAAERRSAALARRVSELENALGKLEVGAKTMEVAARKIVDAPSNDAGPRDDERFVSLPPDAGEIRFPPDAGEHPVRLPPLSPPDAGRPPPPDAGEDRRATPPPVDAGDALDGGSPLLCPPCTNWNGSACVRAHSVTDCTELQACLRDSRQNGPACMGMAHAAQQAGCWKGPLKC